MAGKDRQLAQAPSIALFLQRARMIDPGFELTKDNARALAELVVRLDGLPLAIELAAARTQLLSPQMLLERLGQRLSLLHIAHPPGKHLYVAGRARAGRV